MTNWTEYPINSLTKEDKDYPKNLLALKQPPKQIYYRGELSAGLLKRSIAIVGSRRMTRYGASAVDKFVSSFVSAGTTTISGYMYGVDTEVHARTVEYGGRTVAVMGGGINTPYPQENDKLYTKILQSSGIVLSEYSPELKPKLWMYPKRNRIVAALATIGVLVIEAARESGSLITVNYARELKKKIFAIPGPITSSVSEGTNYLIKEGIATMVTDPADIFNDLKAKTSAVKKKLELNSLELEIYSLLKNEEMTIDEIGIKIDRNTTEISATVSILALKGIISEAGGKYFVV